MDSMASHETTDIEQYRCKHENEKEWDIKREFLLANQDMFEPARLVCLANCYMNIEMYGCRYPQTVMDLLDSLPKHPS